MRLGTKQKLIHLNAWLPWVILVGLYYAVTVQTGAPFEFQLVSGFTISIIALVVAAISGGASLDEWVKSKTRPDDQ